MRGGHCFAFVVVGLILFFSKSNFHQIYSLSLTGRMTRVRITGFFLRRAFLEVLRMTVPFQCIHSGDSLCLSGCARLAVR